MIEYISVFVGFILLIKGADFLVDGSSSLAKRFNVSTLMIGLTIVAFGTSMPEFIVNVIASFKGTTDIAMGNILGSNIANILLILGISALIYPLKVQHSTVWKEIPFSFLAAFILIILANDNLGLSRTDGIVMLSFFIIFLSYVFELARNNRIANKGTIKIKAYTTHKILLMIIFGLLALFIGGKMVTDGVVIIAKNIGISEFMIGLTIVAVGTSLPELVTSAMAAYRRETDLAVGNIIGSNIFNIFFILAISAIITPISIESYVNTDMIVLLIASFLPFTFMFIGERHNLGRWEGAGFILMYIAYIVYIIWRG